MNTIIKVLSGVGVATLLSMSVLAEDRDRDGVGSPDDVCLSTPKRMIVGIDGCKLDTDRDGIYDRHDKCPGTPVDNIVDDAGCPIEKMKAAEAPKRQLTKLISMELNVNFDTDKSFVKEMYYPEIQKVSDFASQYEGVLVIVEGHTDSQGSNLYNKSLSQRRADSVRQVLIDKFGMDPQHVEAVGYGEERPVANNDTEQGRATNRRVIAEISKEIKTEEK